MLTIESLESQLKPLLPGLLGIRLTAADNNRVAATMVVRPVWPTLIKSESGKLCAVVTQTQLVLPTNEDAR